MTVISAVLTQKLIVVSTDSLIANISEDGRRIPIPGVINKPKYVCYPKLRCIASYWGLATIQPLNTNKVVWKTYDWLKSKINIQDKFDNIKDFGQYLADDLDKILSKHSFEPPKYLGIHLTGFEKIEDEYVPELFFISKSTSNKKSDYSRRIDLDRYNHELPEKSVLELRKEYSQLLKNGSFSLYNNGDNDLFNNFANSFHSAVLKAQSRGCLKEGLNKSFYINLAKNPIKEVALFQRKYYIKGSISVGGKIHCVTMDIDGNVEIV